LALSLIKAPLANHVCGAYIINRSTVPDKGTATCANNFCYEQTVASG
jgi:hypothetical protein